MGGITCSNRGFCQGPNTCECQPGYYGVAGGLQCANTLCGDGYQTASSGEQCDDGNVAGNDGCSATCVAEPLPPGFARTLSQTWLSRSVPVQILSRQTDVTAASLAADLGVDELQIQIVRQDGVDVFYKIREYETTCSKDLCDSDGTEKCTMLAGNSVCVCKDGYGGSKCEERLCKHICAHGGRCIAPETCTDCAIGWGGTYCGTVVASSSKNLAVGLVVAVDILLVVAVIIVLIRRRWIPIRARGAASLICSYLGGMIWVTAALASVLAEDFGFDSGQVDPMGWWGAWAP